MNSNDEKVKKILNTEDIPEEISPENMKKMLDEKAPSKKRSGISVAGRITAAAAACAVIVGGTMGTVGLLNRKNSISVDNADSSSASEIQASDNEPVTETVENIQSKAPYMIGAESYEQVYELIQDSKEKKEKYLNKMSFGQALQTVDGAYDDAEYSSEEYEAAAEAERNDDVYFDGAYNEAPMAAESDNSIAVNGGMGGNNSDEPEPIVVIEDEDNKTAMEPPAESTEEVTEESTEEETEEVTEEPTEEETEEVTEEPTEEETEEVTEEPTEEETEKVTEEPTEEETEDVTEEPAEDEEGDEHSDTYSQEKDVLEADIVKTDGKRIYHIKTAYGSEGNNIVMDAASVKDGVFSDSYSVDINFDSDWENWMVNTSASDMYLYNDMIAVICSVDAYCEVNDSEYDDTDFSYYSNSRSKSREETVVAFYTADAEPQLIGTYHQDGRYNDVRISPDGYMYLITAYNADYYTYIDDVNDYESYIPKCGADRAEFIQPADILLPADELDNSDLMSYTVIGSIDLTTPEEFTPCDTKALAGYTGTVYCSADNLYTAVGWDDTDITRISINEGSIVPEASGTVEGYVKDQFSMSEYDGYFRVATTVEKWESNRNFIIDMFDLPYDSEYIRDNRVYVLDMDMNVVGSVEGFGKDETIKSVNFSGNMGYVVTYEQTDPLFAIDLSDPADPFITDKFKILGYSTYMQKWDDGLLLGFGPDADQYGVENGVKLVMFDNSDPYDLKETGLYPIHFNDMDDSWGYSEAVYDRKALLIAPEKNLIGVPVMIETWNEEGMNIVSKYMMFSYEDGEFNLDGEIRLSENVYDKYGYNMFRRALYIGNYVYAVADSCMVSADIETLERTDEVYFN